MILKIFSVYDSKVGAYLTPFFCRSTGEALRAFEQAAKDSSHNFCKYAEDFTLFEVGSFSDEKCQFVMKETPVSLGKAIEFIPVRTSEPDFLDRGVVHSIKEAS